MRTVPFGPVAQQQIVRDNAPLPTPEADALFEHGPLLQELLERGLQSRSPDIGKELSTLLFLLLVPSAGRRRMRSVDAYLRIMRSVTPTIRPYNK
jgi:hypothetical protein